jgi:hypothetical protein
MDGQRAALTRLVEGDGKHNDVAGRKRGGRDFPEQPGEAGRRVADRSVDESPNTELSPELLESIKELARLDLAELFETIRWDAVIDTLLPGEPSRVVNEEPDREV